MNVHNCVANLISCTIIQVWVGSRPWVVVTDPQLCRLIGRAPNRQTVGGQGSLMKGEEKAIDSSNIVLVR